MDGLASQSVQQSVMKTERGPAADSDPLGPVYSVDFNKRKISLRRRSGPGRRSVL